MALTVVHCSALPALVERVSDWAAGSVVDCPVVVQTDGFHCSVVRYDCHSHQAAALMAAHCYCHYHALPVDLVAADRMDDIRYWVERCGCRSRLVAVRTAAHYCCRHAVHPDCLAGRSDWAVYWAAD